jgi:hypothetical protein
MRRRAAFFVSLPVPAYPAASRFYGWLLQLPASGRVFPLETRKYAAFPAGLKGI